MAGTRSEAEELQRELAHFEHRLSGRYPELQKMHTKHDEHVIEIYERLVAAGAAASRVS